MNRCWLEGELRAYLDRELPAQDLQAVEMHLAECSACAMLATELGERAARVGAMLAALEHAPAVCPKRPAPSRLPAMAAAALLAAAACAAFFFIVTPQRQPAIAVQSGSVQRTGSPPPQRVLPTRAEPAKPPHKAKRPQVQYYLALDDEPIESGVVVRVSLPDSGLLADVIYDEQGRPRAVRPLN